jgi:autotransporter-associated beta strand protein
MKLPLLPHRVFNCIPNPTRSIAIFAAITALFFVGAISDAHAQFTFASDNAANYGGTWNNGSDQGSGFGAWALTNGTNAGSFIGNPANNGMGTTGIGTTAFGTFSTGAGYFNAGRSLDTGMGIGDTFSFYWAINWDANGGNKGFDLRSGGSSIFNVNNSNSSSINAGGSTITGFGTDPMLVTLSRTAMGTYSFTMTSRSGGSTFSTNISSTSTIDGFQFYIGGQNDGDGRRNMYFNQFNSTNSGVFSQGGTVTNANTFTGAGNLSVGNNTTLALSGGGNNNYAGTTTISNGSTLRFQGSGTSGFGSAISGAGSLVMSNSGGVLNLGGNNSGFTGTINIAAGILEARNANALGTTAGNTTVANGATLKIFTNSTGFTLADNISISGVGVGGIGAINNTGGNNTLSGGITLSGNSRINADTTGGSGSLTISGNVGGDNNVLFVGALGAVSPTTGGNVVISGVVSGGGGTENGTTSIFKDGIGALTLSGVNTYTGATLLNAGTILIGNNAAFGSGTVQAHFGDFSAAKVLASTDGTARTMANALNIFGSNLTLGAVDRTGGLTFNGNISLGNDTTGVNQRTLTTAVGTSHTFGGIVSGNTSNLLIKSGTGTLTLNGNNTFNAGLQLNDGAILVGNNNALGTGTFQVQFDVVGTKTLASASAANYTIGNNINIFNNLTIGRSGDANGSLTLGGNVFLGDEVAQNRTLTLVGDHAIGGIISGARGIVKQGAGQLTLSGNNTFTGNIFIDNGTINLNGGALGAGTIEIGAGSGGAAAGALKVAAGSFSRGITVNSDVGAGDRTLEFANATGSATLSGTVALEKTVSAVVGTSAATGVLSGVISGVGGLTKTGNGTLTLSGSTANSYSGLTTVSAGTLNLNKASGNAIAGATTISSGAVLLLSASNQVDSGATDVVTLSGGTIQRASGVSEVFGDLNVTANSFLDFSAGTGGTITFTGLDYTPSAILSLRLLNFTQGSSLVFQNTTDMSSLIGSGFTFGGSGGFGGSTFSGSTFTITAIPEPSTYLAAAGLLAMCLWPVRRRLIKDAKSILGLRPNGRDRVEAYRNA